MDFSKAQGSSKIQTRMESHLSNDEPWEEKVRIGQIVHAERGVVEFVATTGKNLNVGKNLFVYTGRDDQTGKIEEEEN